MYTGLACWTGLTSSGPHESNISTTVFDESQSSSWMGFIGGDYARIIMVLLLGAPGLVGLGALMVAHLRLNRGKWSLPGHYRECLWIAAGLGSYAMMFLSIVLLSYLRSEATRDSAGPDSQPEWRFGQIVPLFTWVPVIIEWCYMFVCMFSLASHGLTTLLCLCLLIWPSRPGNWTRREHA